MHPARASAWTGTLTRRSRVSNPGCSTNGADAATIPVQPIIDMGGAPVDTVTFKGAISVNCSAQHALGLVVDGVTIIYQVSDILATKSAPSVVSFNVAGNATNANYQEGKPWIMSVDGNPTNSGTIHYVNHVALYVLNVAGRGDPSLPLLINCGDPDVGVLAISGNLTIPPLSGLQHTLMAKLNGSIVASAWGAFGAVTLSKLVNDVKNGDVLTWYVDGTLVKTHTVALTCADNPESRVRTCTDTDEYSGTAPGGPSPSPTPPRPTPSPTVPPPGYTPTAHSTPNGGGDTTVMNPADIYQPILDALSVGNTGTASRNNSAGNSHDNGADFSKRGHLDDIQPQIETIAGKGDQIASKGGDAITKLRDSFSTLPTNIGTVSSLNFGTGYFNGIGHFTGLPTSISLDPYMDGINLGRLVLLWGLTIFFVYLTVRAFTWTQ